VARFRNLRQRDGVSSPEAPSRAPWIPPTPIASADRIQSVERAEREEVGPDLCRALSNPADKTRLVMLACKQERKLWWLRADYNIPFHKQMERGRFIPLASLLQQNSHSHESKFARVEERDRLTLSFVLASSLLQLYPSFWLEPRLSSHRVYFLTSTASGVVDVRNPFLALDEDQAGTHSRSTPLSNPHRYHGLLGLGIILLEIAGAALVSFEEGTDKCISALERFDELVEEWQLTGSRTVSDGFIRAITACIDPTWLRSKRLDRDSVSDLQMRRYIFEEVVVPLGELLSVAYEVSLQEIGRQVQEPENAGTVEQHDDHSEQVIDNSQRYVNSSRFYTHSLTRGLPDVATRKNGFGS